MLRIPRRRVGGASEPAITYEPGSWCGSGRTPTPSCTRPVRSTDRRACGTRRLRSWLVLAREWLGSRCQRRSCVVSGRRRRLRDALDRVAPRPNASSADRMPACTTIDRRRQECESRDGATRLREPATQPRATQRIGDAEHCCVPANVASRRRVIREHEKTRDPPRLPAESLPHHLRREAHLRVVTPQRLLHRHELCLHLDHQERGARSHRVLSSFDPPVGVEIGPVAPDAPDNAECLAHAVAK